MCVLGLTFKIYLFKSLRKSALLLGPPSSVALFDGCDEDADCIVDIDAFVATTLFVKFFLTTIGIRDIRGFWSKALLRFGAKPNILMGFTVALLEGFGGGAEIATLICWLKKAYVEDKTLGVIMINTYFVSPQILAIQSHYGFAGRCLLLIFHISDLFEFTRSTK